MLIMVVLSFRVCRLAGRYAVRVSVFIIFVLGLEPDDLPISEFLHYELVHLLNLIPDSPRLC